MTTRRRRDLVYYQNHDQKESWQFRIQWIGADWVLVSNHTCAMIIMSLPIMNHYREPGDNDI